MNLTININKDLSDIEFKIIKEPLYFKYLFELFAIASELRFIDYVDGSLRCFLNDKIKRHLEIKDNKLILKKHWAQDYCRNGGCNKKDFVVIQLLLYELYDFYNLGMLLPEIYYDNKKIYPVIVDDRYNPRLGRTTKEMIKAIKKKSGPTGECELKGSRTKDGNILICCVCGDRERELCKI